jgi:MscS family membrane protein
MHQFCFSPLRRLVPLAWLGFSPLGGIAQGAAAETGAAVGAGVVKPARVPDFIEHLVDLLLGLFGVTGSGNTWQHYAIAAAILVISCFLRRVVTTAVFGLFKRLTARTESTLHNELAVSLQKPVAALIAVAGAMVAMKVLELSPETDRARLYVQTVAFAVMVLWTALVTLSTILDHFQVIARKRELGVAAFMPWIKKSLVALILVLGVLLAAQSLGADVKAFLAGLGIGGLAFALAAQDTLANLFGSVVVAIDQPFRIGEFVEVGSFSGTVEDIGLRSTKLRTLQRTLIAIPNKTVAQEAINNFGRMPQRRIEQTVGVTYGSKPEQVEALLRDIRELLKNEPGVHQEFIAVNFVNFGAFSLDLQVIYFAADPDLLKSLELRERINLAIMKLVAANGLGFAFPTQTIEFSGALAERLAAGRKDQGR